MAKTVKFKKLYKILGSLIAIGVMTSCSSIERPVPKAHIIEDQKYIPQTASQSYIRMTDKKGTTMYTCTMPQPDATFSQSLQEGIGINIGTEEVAEGSSEAEMTGRTPTVLMARELFFRTCEFTTNWQLSKEEAYALWKKTFTTVTTLATIQANQTTVTVGDTVATKTTNTEGVTVTGTNTDTTTITRDEEDSDDDDDD